MIDTLRHGGHANDAAEDSFAAVERRIAGTRKRLRGYPQEHVTLVRLIGHVHKRQTEATNRLLKRHGLNHVTYIALMMMYGAEDQATTPSELAAATGEKPTNITRICDELLEQNLIEREPSSADRRRVVLRLTRKGEKLAEQVQPELWSGLQRIFGALSGAEQRQLGGLLRVLLARLDREV